MNGLHVCQARNAPQVGQVKSFVINGDRIKSKPLDQGGQNYTITKVTQHETYKDAYGNSGFHLEIEPQNGSGSTPAPRQQAASAGWSDDRSNRIERQHSQDMAIRWFMGCGKIEDLADLKKLRAMIDYFQKDVGRMPATPVSKSEPEPEHDDAPEPDEEEQF
jgi:hypothetical protein